MVRLRRSVLSVPGSNEKMISKAMGLPADEMMLDLEDGVALEAKEGARSKVIQALQELDWGGRVRAYLYPNNRVFEVWNQRGVNGYADPEQEVDVTVYEGAGPTERWSGSGTADEPHGFYNISLARTGDADAAQVGDLLEVDLGGGEVLATTIVGMGITGVDAVLDQIDGTAPPGETVVIRL